MLQQHRIDGFIIMAYLLIRAVLVLLLFSFILVGQPVQTIDSEAKLASMLCRNPTEAATKELLERNPQLMTRTLWNTLLACASSEHPSKSSARTIEIYKLALRVANRISKPELVATSYYYLGRAYAEIEDFQNSVQAYETSRSLFEQGGRKNNVGYVLAELGALYFAAEDYEKAQSYSEQSLEIAGQIKPTFPKEAVGPIEYSQARSLRTLGELDLHHGNHQEALKKFGQALALYERLDSTASSYKIQMAEVLIAQARVYGEMGQYGKAFSCLTAAHQVSQGSEDEKTSADIMSGQAALFLDQEDYAAAKKYFNASREIYQWLGNAKEEARVLLSMAVIEQRQGRLDEALHRFQQSMDRAEAGNLLDLQIAAGEGLGAALTSKRDFTNALNAINRSLELARRVNARMREAELLGLAAQTYQAMQNYRESAEVAERALTLARPLRVPKLNYWISNTLGESYAADGKVELAISTLKDAVNQIEAMRDEVVGRPETRHLFFENKVGPYHTLVKLLTSQGKNFEALGYAERAKVRVLLDIVRNNRSDLRDIYSESEKAEAELLINKLHGLNQRIQSQTGTRESKDELQNDLNGVRGELVLFQERLAAAHPELSLRAGPAQPLTQANLNSLIPANDFAYLEYVVNGDNIGLFILKRNGVTTDPDLKYLDLAVSADDVRRKVEEFHSALAERHPDYEALGRDLYRLLIRPAANELQSVRTICIIPDEFLWTLPFQALTTTRGNYFIQDYSLYYAPSFSVLNEMALRRRQQSNKGSLIAFGNPVIEKDPNLKEALHPLPEAEAEVTAVATAAQTQMTKVLVGPQADEKTFKTLAPQYATIHLATHGVLDNGDPLNSYLLLAKTDDGEVNDGLLQAREIMDMRLNADLAVLSACETGNGRISPGEGVIGMSWAFLVAGARSVVVSEWRVNSGSTSLLMKNFYQALARQDELNGRNKSQALREASVSLLKDRRYRHPFYWAGFVLISSQ